MELDNIKPTQTASCPTHPQLLVHSKLLRISTHQSMLCLRAPPLYTRRIFSSALNPNLFVFTSMLKFLSSSALHWDVLNLFDQMREREVDPDAFVYPVLIKSAGKDGIVFHAHVMKLGHGNDRYVRNAVMDMYAQKIFQVMGSRDVVSYNTLIAGFAAHGHGTEAVELMLNMKQEGIEPDRLTYIGLLTACSHAGLIKQGWDVFRSIKTPSVDHYACMVDLLGRVGKVDEAMNLIESMSVDPHAGVYGSLLNASRLHRKVEIGEYAANKLFQLEPNNSGNYVLLSNIYATTGRWGDVERIRQSMKNESVKKTTGWSWVEYNGIMHKFIVGDRTHERSEDIYRVLRELGKKMKALSHVADKNCVLRDVEEEEKEEMVGTHSEKLAIGFALLVSKVGAVIRVVKNLRVCGDCHTAIKIISKIECREILVRANNRFHCFNNGLCSCKDYW